MIEVGRVCIKIAGRDAGKKCAVIEILDNNFVMIDGATRRRKCNILHLEPLLDAVKISKGADHESVCKALGLETTKSKPKKAGKKPVKKRKSKENKRQAVKKSAKKTETLIEKVAKKPTDKPVKQEKPSVENNTEKSQVKAAEKPAEKKE